MKFKSLFAFLVIGMMFSCDKSKSDKSDLLGTWILTKQSSQLYDGDKLITSKNVDDFSPIKLDFKDNEVVDYIFDTGGNIVFNYKIDGNKMNFTAVKRDAEDMDYTFEIKDNTLYMYLEVIDDPGREDLANPNLREEYIFKAE